MRATGFIAGKIGFKGRLSAAAIALSFFIIILAVAISAGFRQEIRKGIREISGDILLTTPDFNYFSDSTPIPARPSYSEQLEAIAQVKSLSPAIYRAGIVKSGQDISGVIFKGCEAHSDTSALSVSIPSGLANKMNLSVGDKMLSYFVGEKLKARNFTIGEIYPSILDGEDKLIVRVSLKDMRRLNGWEEGEASALEIQLQDNSFNNKEIREITRTIADIAYRNAAEDEPVLIASSAVDMYGQLFDWLSLIDFNVYAILLLMTLVAGFNMISGLLILLFRNISTIGTLKTMGMSDRGISSVFLRVSARLMLYGMLIGNGLALILCLIQSKTHLLKLNPETYFVSFVPVKVEALTVIAANVAAAAVIMLILCLSARFISRIDPSETVRTE